jgi:hypothetical protein
MAGWINLEREGDEFRFVVAQGKDLQVRELGVYDPLGGRVRHVRVLNPAKGCKEEVEVKMEGGVNCLV